MKFFNGCLGIGEPLADLESLTFNDNLMLRSSVTEQAELRAGLPDGLAHDAPRAVFEAAVRNLSCHNALHQDMGAVIEAVDGPGDLGIEAPQPPG